jgi:hypothetical protein
MRDIRHEQIQASTDAELADRAAALIERYGKYGYALAQLSEFHKIRDEQARRLRGEVA